eukprot:TRINITY_DN229_c0_g1_i1.p1 TRINITY_DN229_c0_g1~~TRINITY_DN229_c0_g1_i1.p1  ORF type:complete len:355 (+),score=63.74 TRINITY_DN229_c0_g1_i1:1-1065(+)
MCIRDRVSTQSTGVQPNSKMDSIVRPILNSPQLIQSLYAASKLELAELLHKKGPQTSTELAQQVSVEPDSLTRILDLLVNHGIFGRNDKDQFIQNEASETLRKDHPDTLYYFIDYSATVIYKSVSHIYDGLISRKCPFELAYGDPLFSYFSKSKEATLNFHKFLSNLQRHLLQTISHVYDWTKWKNSVGVDIGGGPGELLIAIKQAEPSIKPIVFEAPEVIQSASSKENSQKHGISFVAGDFFKDEIPDGDFYLIKLILHDWSDNQCSVILGNLRRSMKGDLKNKALFVIELEYDRNDRQSTNQDVHMYSVLEGARERTEQQYKDLLKLNGFEHVATHKFPNSNNALFEFKPSQ